MAPSYSGVWNLSTQYQYRTDWPIDLNLGANALYAGGQASASPYSINVVEKILLAGSTGNGTDFGDLSAIQESLASASSGTRMLVAGGINANTSAITDTIEYFTYSSSGNATDFGNLTVAKYGLGGLSNNVRGIFYAGYASSDTNVIEYVTISTTGNGTDFGDLSASAGSSSVGFGIMSSTTRGIMQGYNSNVIDYITIASEGNARDFGDMTVTRKQGVAHMSSATRGVFGGGRNSSNAAVNVIDYITIASKSNATDFGDLLTAAYAITGFSSSTKGFIGGNHGYANTIEQITFTTTGNATDFGDLTASKSNSTAASNGQAGVQALTSLPSAGNTGLMTGALDSFIESIDIATLGNSVAFGDISYTYINGSFGGASSATRMCVAGATSNVNSIDLTIFATRGKGTDFGDLVVGGVATGNSNSTRGLFSTGGASNTIDYITIASAGNATDFGNLYAAASNPAMAGNTTRMLFMGGDQEPTSPRYLNEIGYVTISSTGNTTDFGDLLQTLGYGQATSSSTRVVYCGGYNGSAGVNTIQYVTTASTGNATDFGDLLSQWTQGACFSNGTRAIIGQGYNWETDANQNIIQYFTIASTGDSADFGDALNSSNPAGQSNGHGGIA